MRNFEYFTSTRVIFGKDTHLKIGTVLKEQNCSKVLIHYGSHSAVSSGLIDEIRSSWMKPGSPMSLLAVWFPIPVSLRYVKVLSFAAKNRLIFFWLLAVAVLLIPARPSAMDLPIQIQMYGTFSPHRSPKSLSSRRRYPDDRSFRK